jgi:hypothetical protein
MSFSAGATTGTIITGVEAVTGTEGKPTPDELGIDLARVMRVAGDQAGRILVFDRNEWDCFLDGARNGEFDDATSLGESDS